MATHPKKAKIIGQPYTIRFLDVVTMSDGELAQGTCSSQTSVIEIRKSNAVLEVDTLIHEILHAIEYKMGLANNEHYVNRFATGLTQVFKDNPAVLKYITERLKES
jgi:hypothetical protein